MSENTQNGQNMNGQTQNPKNKISLEGEMIKRYEFKNYLVIIYEIKSDEAPLEFYAVSLDDGSQEIVWGVGQTEEEAVENAMNAYEEYDTVGKDDDFNPFEKALRGEDNRGEDNE